MYRLYEGEVINFFRTSVCSDIYLSYPNLNPNQATMDSIRNLLASVPKLDFGKHANIYANSPKIIHELRRYVLPTELLLTKKGIHPKTPTKNEIFSAILQNYSSTLRENLLYYFLKSYVTISDAEEYRKFLNEAYSLTKHPEIRSRYELLIQANGINKPIYDYAFTDINGGKISLSSFKGKVVFLDYWYTGCIPCVRLAKLIEEKVRPDLPDEDIVFVSINGDKERNEWINSVKSGIYGPKDGINLFTDGLLFDHPFVRYYGFVGAPTMMIIDRNSRVLYKNVPHDPEVIKKYLHDALTQE